MCCLHANEACSKRGPKGGRPNNGSGIVFCVQAARHCAPHWRAAGRPTRDCVQPSVWWWAVREREIGRPSPPPPARLKRRRLSQRQTGLRSPMHPDRKRCSFVGALERRPGRGASALATVRPPRAPASSFRAPFGYKLSLDQVALGGAPGLLCTLHSSLPTGAQLAPMRFNQRPPSDHRGRLSGNKCRAEAPRWRPSSRDKSTIQWGGSRDAPRGAGKSQDALR